MKRKFILAVAVLAAISIPEAFCEAQPATSEAAEAKMENSTNPEIAAEQANAEAAETPAEAELEPPNPESDFKIDFNEDVTEVYITKYIGKSDKIIFPETIQGLPVTRIIRRVDDDFMYSYSSVKKIVVPKSVKRIGSSVFSKNLADNFEVVLSEGLEYIGPSAFSSGYLYRKISSINFPSTLKVICRSAFYGTKIENVVLNEGLEYIGDNAFNNCDIKNLTLPASIKYFNLYFEHSKIFSMASDGEVNLPKDTSGYKYAYNENLGDKKLTYFFGIHVDSQIATERRKQVELKRKLDAVTVKYFINEYNSYKEFCRKYNIED